MRRNYFATLGLVLALSLTACGGSDTTEATTVALTTAETIVETVTETITEVVDDSYGGNDSDGDTAFNVDPEENLSEEETEAVAPSDDVEQSDSPSALSSGDFEHQYQYDIHRMIESGYLTGLTAEQVEMGLKEWVVSRTGSSDDNTELCIANVIRYDGMYPGLVVKYDSKPLYGDDAGMPVAEIVSLTEDGHFNGSSNMDPSEMLESDLAYFTDVEYYRQICMERFGRIPEKTEYESNWQAVMASVCADNSRQPNDYTYEQCMAIIDEFCKTSGINMSGIYDAELRVAYTEEHKPFDDHDYIILKYHPGDGSIKEYALKISKKDKCLIEEVNYKDALDEVDNWRP